MEIRIATKDDLEKVFALRTEVFVGEQHVPPDIEFDNKDGKAIHFIALLEGVAVGCARILTEDGSAHIGRLAVKKSYRNKGVGSSICKFVINYCRLNGYDKIWLNSQLHAVKFYERLGFETHGEPFFEAWIEHIKMILI